MRTIVVDYSGFYRRPFDGTAKLHHNNTVSWPFDSCYRFDEFSFRSIYALYRRNIKIALALLLYITTQAAGSLAIDFRYPFTPSTLLLLIDAPRDTSC